MKQYSDQKLFASIRALMTHWMTQDGHTLDEAISYAIVELGMMPQKGDDLIWAPLDFTALFTVALENRVEGAPDRELSQHWSGYVRDFCVNESTVSEALETERDRQAFLTDLGRVRAAFNIP